MIVQCNFLKYCKYCTEMKMLYLVLVANLCYERKFRSTEGFVVLLLQPNFWFGGRGVNAVRSWTSVGRVFGWILAPWHICNSLYSHEFSAVCHHCWHQEQPSGHRFDHRHFDILHIFVLLKHIRHQAKIFLNGSHNCSLFASKVCIVKTYMYILIKYINTHFTSTLRQVALNDLVTVIYGHFSKCHMYRL